MTAHFDRDERIEPIEAKEPIAIAEASEPMLPNDSTDPMLPTDRIEPLDAIDRNESCDHNDHRELPVSSVMGNSMTAADGGRGWRGLRGGAKSRSPGISKLLARTRSAQS